MMNRTLYLLIFLFVLAPAISLANSIPEWVEGKSQSYPNDRYLTGVGFGGDRKAAENEAYAAISKIFSARISTVDKDYERYTHIITSKNEKHTVQEASVERYAEVTSDRSLENAAIAETWFDEIGITYYALAVIDRAKAANTLAERINSLDGQIERMVAGSRATADKFLKIRDLHGALNLLVKRDAYNADLSVIRLSGKGMESIFKISAISSELNDFLKTGFAIGIDLPGEAGSEIKSAIVEGLNKQGFTIVESDRPHDLSIVGKVELSEIELQNPKFKFVRWTADFSLIDKKSERVIGNITKSGKEGHATIKEARIRALNSLKKEIADEINKRIVEFIYGNIRESF